MGRTASTRLALALALAATLAAQPARGDEPTDAQRARATELKAGGDSAMEAFRYADALAAYDEAYAITRNPALLYNMGRALQALNRFPQALEKLEAFEREAPAELLQRVPRLAALIAEMRQRVATVIIRTNVDGARIVVRDTVVGRSPLGAPLRLTAGKAVVEIEAEGYFPRKEDAELPGGGAIALDMPLYSRSTTGILVVRASAAGAEVFVDGARKGIAPLETNLPGGVHRIVVTHPDHADYETSASVVAGGRKDVVATLESPSVVTRWWFWGGVGAVAAASAVITIALLTERSPDSGDIPPGQLQAPKTSHPLFTF
ncbi:MAG: PEGA domain-containing protein [Polyangiaceae bacterium]